MLSRLQPGAGLCRRLALVALWLLPLQVCNAAAATIYRFSPDNEFSIHVMGTYWNPIVAYLSTRTGLDIRLKLGRSLEDTGAYPAAGETDLVFTAELDEAEGRPLRAWTPFAVRRGGQLHMEILTRANARLAMLDLNGKRVAFASASSGLFRLVQADLARRGVQVQPVFSGNPDAAQIQLMTGNVAAAAVMASSARSFEARMAANQKTLWRSAATSRMVFLAAPHVPSRDVAAIRDALTGMGLDAGTGRAILASAAVAAGLDPAVSFRQFTSDAHLAQVRTVMH